MFAHDYSYISFWTSLERFTDKVHEECFHNSCAAVLLLKNMGNPKAIFKKKRQKYVCYHVSILSISYFQKKKSSICNHRIVYVRQGSAQIFAYFADLASFLAEGDEEHTLSYHFARIFFRGYKEEVWTKIGKITSPMWWSKTMLSMTNKFISD